MGCMLNPHWAGGVNLCSRLIGLEKLVFMVFSRQGSSFQSYPLLGVRVGCMHIFCWESGFALVNFHWVIDNIKRSKYYQGKAK